jgi:hypothetical protein
VALVLLAANSSAAQSTLELRAERVPTPPRIDGSLDDAAWQGPALALGQWVSYNPLRGEPTDERTDVRIAYDDRYLFFAFHCFDSDPSNIRTTVSRRDDAFNDDWIALSLDSAGRGQSAYHLFVNPSGVQMDAVNTSAAGEQFENDFVWESAGRRTTDGYTVEIALPLQSIRFGRNAAGVTMGILFFRHFSRSGKSYSWPDMPPGQWVFNRHARLVFPDLKPRRLAEVLPSATLPLSQTRTTPNTWNGVEGSPDLGVSAKYGVTSEVTLDATINPDFSQVESDAFQVQVNQRFPIYFSEKRPFFMEGLGLFSMAGTGGDSNIRTAVHTRRVVNPAWGAKVTGSEGRLAFGYLQALDETPQDLGDRGAIVDGRNKLFTIGRATYSFGGSDYVGAIVTDTEHAGRHNRVAGGDASWKPTNAQAISASYLFSQTGIGSTSDGDGSAALASYSYETRRVTLSTLAEHYGDQFQMDTAFYNRTGFSAGFVYGEVNFYPEKAKRFGLIRLHPFIAGRRGYDHLQGGSEAFTTVGTTFNFERQGFLRVQHTQGHEAFAGQRFRTGDPFAAFGNVQLFRWLNVGANYFHRGWQTFYDPESPYQGRSTTGGFDLTWQPNQHFNQSVSYSFVHFNRADTGARVFTVDIVNAKTVYQFNTHFLTRLIEQFDSSRHQLLTDLLASYEFVPGTVVHAGYGSFYEERTLEDGRLVPGPGKYMTVNRGLFFKASYLYRF